MDNTDLVLTPRTVTILMVDGSTKKSVSMMTTGAWGIHPEIKEIPGKGQWVITFIPTGGALGKYPSKKTAVTILGLILGMVPELHHTRDKAKSPKHRPLLLAASKGLRELKRYVATHGGMPAPTSSAAKSADPVSETDTGPAMLPLSEINWSGVVDWEQVDEAIARLNRVREHVRILDPHLLERLKNGSGDLLYTSLSNWISALWGHGVMSDLYAAAANVGMFAQEVLANLSTPSEPKLRQALAEVIDEYTQAISAYVSQAGPERLTYQGLKVLNPARLPDAILRRMLDGLDYMRALFARRGVSAILTDTIKTIEVRFRASGEGMLGFYHPRNRTITIMAETLTAGKGRLLEGWLNEAVVHEIGHHIQTLLPPAAEAEWDRGWASVRQNEALLAKMDVVLAEDRRGFWELLVAAKGDFAKAGRGLDDLGKLKFSAWAQSHWTKPSKEAFRAFLQDSETFIREDLQDAGPPEWQAKELALGIPFLVKRQMDVFKNQAGADPADLQAGPWLTASPELQKYRREHSTEEIVKSLGIPTDYGRTNAKEDFAETFMWFLVAPEKLSETALYRIKRALSLAGFYGKPIMRVARRWLASGRALASL